MEHIRWIYGQMSSKNDYLRASIVAGEHETHVYRVTTSCTTTTTKSKERKKCHWHKLSSFFPIHWHLDRNLVYDILNVNTINSHTAKVFLWLYEVLCRIKYVQCSYVACHRTLRLSAHPTIGFERGIERKYALHCCVCDIHRCANIRPDQQRAPR